MKRALFILLAAAAGLATAQTTYTWTDPATGSTIYSDQPPPTNIKRVTKKAGEEPGNTRQQPYALRRAAENFPVTIYTSAECGDVCQRARSLLNERGVPFKEKVVQAESPEMDELKKLTGGEGFVPSISVGRQSSKGFEAGAWNNLLDTAGYPKTAGPFAK